MGKDKIATLTRSLSVDSVLQQLGAAPGRFLAENLPGELPRPPWKGERLLRDSSRVVRDSSDTEVGPLTPLKSQWLILVITGPERQRHWAHRQGHPEQHLPEWLACQTKTFRCKYPFTFKCQGLDLHHLYKYQGFVHRTFQWYRLCPSCQMEMHRRWTRICYGTW